MINRKHIWIVILFILLGVAAFLLAGRGNDSEENKVSLYFLDKNGYVITPVEIEIKADSKEDLYLKVARNLINGPESKKYMPIMDSSVKVNRIDVQKGKITIDFSDDYPKDNYMCTYAVIKTYSRLKDIIGVKVTVDGEEILGTDGVALGFVNGEDINTESAEDTATGIRLYFASTSSDELVMEYRKINIVDTQPVEQYIISELIKGPKIDGCQRLLAPDTKVLSVETTDGICYVNFKKGFIEKNMAPAGGTDLLVESVVKSLTDLKNVEGVQFLVDGKKTDRLGDTNISEIFEKEKPVEIKPEEPKEPEPTVEPIEPEEPMGKELMIN